MIKVARMGATLLKFRIIFVKC